MKKIIFRKLLLDCLIFFFLALFGISTIIWVFQAVNFLDIMIEDGRNYNVYFNYTLLNFPKIISRIWINIIKIEAQKKKFTILNLLTQWFQKIINSLLASYLTKV